MTENLTHIHIFKTNIYTETDKLRVKIILDAEKAISEWSIDLEDTDRVLRVVSYELCLEKIAALIHNTGFDCQELD